MIDGNELKSEMERQTNEVERDLPEKKQTPNHSFHFTHFSLFFDLKEQHQTEMDC